MIQCTFIQPYDNFRACKAGNLSWMVGQLVQTDWRGKVQHVNSGEVLYFRDWPTLEALVEGLVRNTNPEGPQADEDITPGHHRH
jgi:hypothetical protein